MLFDILTIFPNIFDSYINESIIKRAREKKIIDIRIHNLRDYTRDAHKTVDEKPYGGGAGMVFKIEPIVRAVETILKKKSGTAKETTARFKIVLFSASGTQFTRKVAQGWARKYSRLIMIPGHYEGIDERVKKVLKAAAGSTPEEISIGPYVLTGGELPAMVVMDAVARHLPGALGNETSLEEKRGGIGIPVFTRPEIFEWRGRKYRVPAVLLSGDHKKVDEWRQAHRHG
ncbi:MAG: tRNA (guanosine(37)-N1)-methyltransferase TrmD [Patescibacteria group bacterium]